MDNCVFSPYVINFLPKPMHYLPSIYHSSCFVINRCGCFPCWVFHFWYTWMPGAPMGKLWVINHSPMGALEAVFPPDACCSPAERHICLFFVCWGVLFISTSHPCLFFLLHWYYSIKCSYNDINISSFPLARGEKVLFHSLLCLLPTKTINIFSPLKNFAFFKKIIKRYTFPYLLFIFWHVCFFSLCAKGFPAGLNTSLCLSPAFDVHALRTLAWLALGSLAPVQW